MKKIAAIFLAILIFAGLCPIWGNAAGAGAINGCISLQAYSSLGRAEDYTGTAQSVILYEMNTDTMVYSVQPDTVTDPAGMVKIMTALVALENVYQYDSVPVTAEVLDQLPSGATKLKLQEGDRLSVRDLVNAIVLGSYDDAAMVLANYVSGSQEEFVALMNEKAQQLGCTNTHFVNAHGISQTGQQTTARDLAVIISAALENEIFTQVFSLQSFQLPSSVSGTRSLTTSCDLLNQSSRYYDSRVTGGKAVKTANTKGHMVCVAQSGDSRYLCILLSTTENKSGYTVTDKEMAALLSTGFESYSLQAVYSKDQAFDLFAVSGGENSVSVSPAEDVSAILPADFDPSLISYRSTADTDALVAPVTAGTVVGTMQVSYNGLLIAQVDLVARYDVATKGSSIQTVSTTGSKILKVVLWVVGITLGVAVLLALVLLIIRQINVIRHNKKRRAERRRRVREES